MKTFDVGDTVTCMIGNTVALDCTASKLYAGDEYIISKVNVSTHMVQVRGVRGTFSFDRFSLFRGELSC